MRTDTSNVDRGAAAAKVFTGAPLFGIGATVSLPVALGLALAYFAIDQIFDINTQYKDLINWLSGASRKEGFGW